ncbi:3-hydroxyacyl-CoA dehydrogenase family protein [Streptomyces sp. NPDC047813]|uniref:3-hydroxyacyl-CoA dehydrogenase family protein n=1 Tax=Streptomyces sp. NPDC047813 TaxID=3154608 RepID=UPI0033CC110F
MQYQDCARVHEGKSSVGPGTPWTRRPPVRPTWPPPASSALDTVLETLEVLRHRTGEPRFEPCPLLTGLVAAGDTGRKSGRSFHTYRPHTAPAPLRDRH